MITFASSIDGHEQDLVTVKQYLEQYGFSAGGDWEYDSGFFDCSLDEAQKLWLRIPFEVTKGSADFESDDNEARIRLGAPFALKHQYNEGLDAEARPRLAGALFDQFQTPVDPDDELAPNEVVQAEKLLRQIEADFPH